MDLELIYFNIEGELIDKIQEFGFRYDGIILNAGAYTHTSIGMMLLKPLQLLLLKCTFRTPTPAKFQTPILSLVMQRGLF
jgi:hypothetical protein